MELDVVAQVGDRFYIFETKTGETLSDNAQKFFDFALSAEAAQYITSAGAVPVNG